MPVNVIGMIGVAVIMGPIAIGRVDSQLLAQASILCSAFSIALAGVYGRVLFGVPPPAACTSLPCASAPAATATTASA